VTRQTVNGWKNNDPEFIAELNRQRERLREMHHDKLQVIIGKALQVVESELDNTARGWKREAAFHVLKTLSSHIKDVKIKSVTNEVASSDQGSGQVNLP
jgi:hypothetical protein